MRIIAAALLTSIGLAATQKESPEDVIRRFVRLDLDGAQLTPKGQETIAALFVRPGPPLDLKEVGVVKDRFDIRPPLKIRDDKAEVRVDYTHLGFLDVSTAVFRTEAAYLHLIEDFTLGFKYSLQRGTPSAWRIDGTMRQPKLGVTGAIRFLEDLRTRTTNERIKRNASRSIAGLKRQ